MNFTEYVNAATFPIQISYMGISLGKGNAASFTHLVNAILYPIYTLACSVATYFRYTAQISLTAATIDLSITNDFRTTMDVVTIPLILFVIVTELICIGIIYIRIKYIRFSYVEAFLSVLEKYAITYTFLIQETTYQ
jgi:hypothetical protein